MLPCPHSLLLIVLLTAPNCLEATVPIQPASAAGSETSDGLSLDLAEALKALNAERQAGLSSHEFGDRQRKLLEQAVRADAVAGARALLRQPELVMVDQWWMLNVQAYFRLWGEVDLPAMAAWVEEHPLHAKMQPCADYAILQLRLTGLTESEAIALWRRQAPATRHWAKRDIASLIAASDPATALARIARIFPAAERGEMLSLAIDVVVGKHPESLLPWLEETAPFFYNEPNASAALFRLPEAEVETALLKLPEPARAQIALEYMRECLKHQAAERGRKAAVGVDTEPYKSLITKELSTFDRQNEGR